MLVMTYELRKLEPKNINLKFQNGYKEETQNLLTKLSLKTTKAKPLSYIKKEPSLWQESDAKITVLVPELNALHIN